MSLSLSNAEKAKIIDNALVHNMNEYGSDSENEFSASTQ